MAVSPTSLFPLPLTVFERYLLLDHRLDYPMVFPVQFNFGGQVTREAWETALEEVLPRHPLLTACVEPCGRRGLCFVPYTGPPPVLTWQTDATPPDELPWEFLDLTREPGVRLWMRPTEAGTTLTVLFHHACCDGLGAFGFLGDLFAAYGQRTAGASMLPQMAPRDLTLLHRRGQFAFDPPEPVGRTQIVWSTLREAAKWAVRRPTPLAVPSDEAAAPRLAGHRFEEAQSRALRHRASQSGATLNDLLLRDLFLTLAQWNAEHAPARSGRWWQINMPQNLREAGDEAMPAANKLGYVFLTRPGDALADAETLLQGLHAETELIKKWSAGLLFLSGLEWAWKIPGLCRAMLARRQCLATAVLSNLSDLARRLPGRFPQESGRLRLGNLWLEGGRMAPPTRPLTSATLAAFRYRGCLNINLLNSRDLAPAAAEDLLRCYVRRLEQSMAEGQEHNPHWGKARSVHEAPTP